MTMMRVDVTRMPASAALRLGLLAGFLAVAGCSDPASGDKRDDPALKASMQKSMEIYKSKTQAEERQGSTRQACRSGGLEPAVTMRTPRVRTARRPPGRGWRDRGRGPMGLRIASGRSPTRLDGPRPSTRLPLQ